MTNEERVIIYVLLFLLAFHVASGLGLFDKFIVY